ncbi:MAG TPA: methyltransferase domain-containing protein [Blastocatellia bacterium]|nr:methyltransferase domain-containing protein [Blastocatellia bacterium]
MSRTRLYQADIENVDLNSEIKRLYHQANLNPEKEGRNLINFGLRDGMSVLEVASGPGFVTEWLSKLAPNGSITCVEIDPTLIQHAEGYLKDKAASPYRIIEGSVMNMDLPDNTFDFAFVRLLYEHLEDTVAATKEIMRVLKPGAKLVVAEGDNAFNNITDPFFKEVQPIREKMVALQFAQGGNVMIGRGLYRVFKSAGLENIDIEAVAAHSGDKGLEWFYPQFNPERLAPGVKEGIITEDEYQLFRSTVEKFMSSKDSFYLRILLMVCGQKPLQQTGG